jgi:aspartyl-tRNA synthetase
LRIELAHELNMIPEDTYKFVWIVDWPLLEYSEEEKDFMLNTIHLQHQVDPEVLKDHPKEANGKSL